MTLQQIKYAVTIARHESMSQAAKALFIAQPTLSNALKDLEEEIGVSLFTRTNKGILVTAEGKRFLGYANQVLEHTQLLEEAYLGANPKKQKFSISTQHYSFTIAAYIDLIKCCGADTYDFTIRESKTYDIIEDVRTLKSEIGILYMNDFNEKVLTKMLRESQLVFKELFVSKPHVFVSVHHPFASMDRVPIGTLKDYPYISFDQGDQNALFFSEEILSTLDHDRIIHISDRATLLNLLIGLNGYTISTSITCEELNGRDQVTVPLDVDDYFRIGYITHKDLKLSALGEKYIKALRQYLS